MNQYVGLDVSLGRDEDFTFLTKLAGASGAVSVRAIPTNSRRPSASMRRVRCGSASRLGR